MRATSRASALLREGLYATLLPNALGLEDATTPRTLVAILDEAIGIVSDSDNEEEVETPSGSDHTRRSTAKAPQ